MNRRLMTYVAGELIAPFFLGLSLIVFVFLMNFIIKSIDRILGKGIDTLVILEYIGLNLAWIFALAVPMALLIAALMAYGRLAADNEITAFKAAGISFYTLLVPGLIIASLLTALMIYFNNSVLPEFNHRARMLGSDIYRKRPDLNIEEGYFVSDLPKYSLLVKKKNKENLEDITIYSKESARVQTTVIARTGKITVEGNRIVLNLFDGEIHELNVSNPDEYRRIEFEKHIVTIPVSNMILERSNTRRRGDREMSAQMMRKEVLKFEEKIRTAEEKIHNVSAEGLSAYLNESVFRDTVDSTIAVPDSSAPLIISEDKIPKALTRVSRKVRRNLQLITAEENVRRNYRRQKAKYSVEIQKKYSIPAACIVFMLIGAPLGVIARHGGLVVGGSLSLTFFIIYWAFLVAGEQFADRLFIPTFWAMWTPNILMGALGVYLVRKTAREVSPWDVDHIIERLKSFRIGKSRDSRTKEKSTA